MSIGALLWSWEGRIGRGRFWSGVVLVILMSMVLAVIASLLEIPLDAGTGEVAEEISVAGALYLLAAFIAVAYAQLAVYAKRFHDRGKSAWWVLIAFVPVIGFLWVVIELGMLPGEPGPNAYGPAPEFGAAVPA
jgi:uncharacterized membrane protein YhaH (DUF805 family)